MHALWKLSGSLVLAICSHHLASCVPTPGILYSQVYAVTASLLTLSTAVYEQLEGELERSVIRLRSCCHAAHCVVCTAEFLLTLR